MFYILSMDGRPLMPTSRYRHIKELIRTGRAVKVSSVPFTVRLLYSTPEQTQPLFYGKDPGRTNIGAAVVDCKGNPVFMARLVTRNREIPKLMSKRAEARKKHRSYGRRKRRQRRAVAADTKEWGGTCREICSALGRKQKCWLRRRDYTTGNRIITSFQTGQRSHQGTVNLSKIIRALSLYQRRICRKEEQATA